MADFEFKSPIIISKSPMKYAFQLLQTHPIVNTYNSIVGFDIIQEENHDEIKRLVDLFCNKCSKYFSKPLDSNRFISRLTHIQFSVNAITDDNEMPDGNLDNEPVIYEWSYSPYRIIISGTEFIIEWCLDQIEVKCSIDIPDFIDTGASEPVVQLGENEVIGSQEGELLEEDNIPVAEDNNPVIININEGEIQRDVDNKKLKKAQLKVKMAKFKAERAYEKYIQKWGYLSEDSGSETD
jgi:hypothetical protein